MTTATPKKVEIDINNIPIEYLNTDTVLAQRGLMLLEEGTTQTVNVKLTASTRWNSTSLDRSAVRATVDLADVTETGTQRLNITILYPDGTEGISKKSSSPSMATVNIGELYHKEVEVRCERVGTVPRATPPVSWSCRPPCWRSGARRRTSTRSAT